MSTPERVVWGFVALLVSIIIFFMGADYGVSKAREAIRMDTDVVHTCTRLLEELGHE